MNSPRAEHAPQVLISLSSFGAAEVRRHGQAWFARLAAQAGADGVEVRGELLVDGNAELAAIHRTAGSIPRVYSSPAGLWNDEGELDLAALELGLEAAVALGAGRLKMSIGGFQGASRGSLKSLANRLAAAQAELVIENDQTSSAGTLVALNRFFDAADAAGVPLGMTFDMGNWHWTGECPLQAASSLSQPRALRALQGCAASAASLGGRTAGRLRGAVASRAARHAAGHAMGHRVSARRRRSARSDTHADWRAARRSELRMTLDVVTLGEAMMMLVADRPGPIENAESFVKRTAGAETNVAIGLSRLGLKRGLGQPAGHGFDGTLPACRHAGRGHRLLSRGLRPAPAHGLPVQGPRRRRRRSAGRIPPQGLGREPDSPGRTSTRPGCGRRATFTPPACSRHCRTTATPPRNTVSR